MTRAPGAGVVSMLPLDIVIADLLLSGGAACRLSRPASQLTMALLPRMYILLLEHLSPAGVYAACYDPALTRVRAGGADAGHERANPWKLLGSGARGRSDE